MAITATFSADFSGFVSAIERADVKLRGLDTSSRFVERSLNRMTDNFSGRKLIQEATLMVDAIDRIGGKSKLTEQELQSVGNKAAEAAEKMKRMGVEVPPKLDELARSAQKPVGAFQSLIGTMGKLNPLMAAFGASLSIGAVVGFAKEIGNFAGQMLDLSVQTGLSTTRLQAFNLVGAGSGLTIDDIATSADQLSKRLGDGDKSVVSALEKMGLSAETLKSKNLDQVMFDIDRALVGVNNQYERANILNDLFGRSGARMGRILTGSLEDVTKTAEKTGAIIDEKLLQKADAFDDAWKQGWIKFRAYAVEAVDYVGGLLSKLADAATQVGRAMREDANSNQFGLGRTGGPNITYRTGPLRTPRNIVAGSIAPDIIQGSGLPKTIKELADTTKSLADAMKAADEEAAKYRDHLNEVGLRMMQADAAAMAFFRQMGTGVMAMRATNNPQLLLESTNPFTALGINARPGALRQSGSAGFGMAAGSLAPLLGIGGSLRGAVGGLPATIMAALQGGGNIAGSIGGLFGSSLFGAGTGLNKAISGGLSGVLGKTLGGALGSVLPGVGALIGPAIQGLTKLFGGLFGAEGKKTNRARDAAIADFTGISGDKGASQAKFRELATAAGIASSELDKLFSTKKQKEFEAGLDSISKKMNEFASEQEADAARLTAAIEKYGISFEQAGAAFQKQELDKQAKELIEDWRVLVGSGIDVGLVNEKMSESINDYLQTAIRVGQEVPAALRPIITKMLEQGLLTDEAGNAITDLEDAGIHFSETMTEGFDKVVKKLDELIAKLGLAAGALGDLPVPTGDVSGIAPSFGGDQAPPYTFASGTHGRFLSFGAGTPAMLHGRERVVTEAEGRMEAAGWGHVASRVDALGEQLLRMTEGLQRMTRDNLALAMGQRA